MADLADAIQALAGVPATIRVGVVTAVSPLTVMIQGAALDPESVGVLGSYLPRIGDTVAVIGQSPQNGPDPDTWLVLGNPTSTGRPILPGERVGITENTSDSGNFTSETVVMTITVTLEGERTYSIWSNPGLMSDNSGDVIRAQLREDSIAGNILDSTIEDISNATASSTRKHAIILYSDYTAPADETKTFVVTGMRATGAGNIHLEGSSSRKSYIIVRYESG